MKVYQTDESGVLLYAQDAAVLPYGAVLLAPPRFDAGFVAVWDRHGSTPRTAADFGSGSINLWDVVEDHRADTLYLVNDGQQYTVGSDASGKTYNGLGEIPGWLSAQPRPSLFHFWIDGAWVLNEQAQADSDAAAERAWRDAEIQRVTPLRDRHRDEAEQGIETTLSASEYAALLVYIQALRDWPASPDFPDVAGRPEIPTGIAVPA